ncbi:hypothetical protein EDB89DRAFT_1907625 [Lactarius sanguifluus]|nr:hypothetical protein EDB89DRAFT_1907625 [Lactarius sanguifluus]
MIYLVVTVPHPSLPSTALSVASLLSVESLSLLLRANLWARLARAMGVRCCLAAVVASPLFLPLVSWRDAAGVASVADTIELAFLHWHGWDGAWCGIDGGVVAIVAGCMQGSTPTTSLKLYATTNHPRDPTSRDPNHDDGSNKWRQRSLSNNYNTNSGSNTTTSSQLRPPHLGTGKYKARSTATTAGKVTTTTARHGEATTTDSKTKSAATTTSPRKSPQHSTVRHDNSEGEQ